MATISMTANWIKAVLLPTTGRAVWYDEKIKGLGLRVSASGKKSWFVEYRVKGDRTKRNLTLDPYPVMSLADARELAAKYLERYAKMSKKSWTKDEWYLNAIILPA